MFGGLLNWGKAFAKARTEERTFDQYVASFPSLQNAVDAVPGWSTSFPPECGVTAGALATYADARIAWAIECFGSLQDRDVLELGPLEAGHTAMLEWAGARVDAVEANQRAYMRCLIAKEILRLQNSRFLLGDFVKWLDATDKCYDLIVASGVLYHLHDPLRLLELIARRTSAAYFWTHVVAEDVMPPKDPRRSVLSAEPEQRDFHGVKVRAYRRTYLSAPRLPAFCGGMCDEHWWLEKDDLLAALRALGFDDIRTTHYEPDHQFGPAISIFARKS